MRFRFFPCLLFVMMAVLPAWATPPTPVLRWVFDTSGSQKDLGVAPAANGTLTNNAITAYNSPLSFSCKSLDLTASGSNYVTSSIDIDKIDALPQMTVSCWINMRADPAALDCILSDDPSGTPPNGQGGWSLSVGSSPTANNFPLQFGVSRNSGGTKMTTIKNFTVTGAGSAWVFVAVTYSADFRCRGYVGNETAAPALVSGVTNFGQALLPNSAHFRVGSSTAESTFDRTPPAWIDDVRIYDQALSDSDLDLVRLSSLYGAATPSVPAFFGIGDLPGGSCLSTAEALSADGTTIVGTSVGTSGIRAYRWRYNTMQTLSDPASASTSTQALGVSADGSFVAGHRGLTSALEAMRWDAAGAGTPLGDLPGGSNYSAAFGLSADGSTAVGQSIYTGTTGAQAFEFTTAMTALGFLPGDTLSAAFGISADASVIVGGSSNSINTTRACYWQDGVCVPLGDLSDGIEDSLARRISADKRTVVGFATSASGREAALWRAGRLIGLGDFAGGNHTSYAYAVSGRGSYIVGYGTGAGSPASQAFIWDRQHGMRDLKTVLQTDYSLDVTGWALQLATGISDDGAVISGGGTNPAGITEAWIARLPVPPAIGDFDGNGHVDYTDAETFAACTTGPGVVYGPGTLPVGCPMALDVLGLLAADFDWDNDVDLDDFAAFQLCFSGPDFDPPSACRG